MTADPVVSAAQSGGVAQLQNLLEALGKADAEAYFSAADALDRAATLLSATAEQIEERSERIFRGAGGAECWEGQAARATEELAASLVVRLRGLAGLADSWATEAGSAGEAINSAAHEVNDVIRNASKT
ncbi:hypothetical protein ACFUJR_34565 [Streptomyces sp. NPDC057271]|uniref:hypothetical protein n=1 Tax=unclassified Streptomyces TaxID=2593676 RepID=UPI003631A5D9